MAEVIDFDLEVTGGDVSAVAEATTGERGYIRDRDGPQQSVAAALATTDALRRARLVKV